MPSSPVKRKLLFDLHGLVQAKTQAQASALRGRQRKFLKFREPFKAYSVNGAVCSLCEVISRAESEVGLLDFFVQHPIIKHPEFHPRRY